MVLFLLAEQFLLGTYRKMIFKDADRKRKEREAIEQGNDKEGAQAWVPSGTIFQAFFQT